VLAYVLEYTVFLLELVTIAAIVVVSFLIILSAAKKPHEQSHLSIEHLNESLRQRTDAARRTILGKRESRKLQKARRKEDKQNNAAKDDSANKRPRLFVLDFKGDIRATATASLREEVSAVIELAGEDDEVLVRLENAGGAVHEHGLAASQLLRLRARGIPLTVAVDKVAASGGYLMACAGDRIVAAPFAVIGSIGVLMQMPNFHRLLEQKGVDFEQITAGKFKRTLTVFGENTDEGREKVKEELIEVHELFQSQPGAFQRAVGANRLKGVLGTRGLEAAPQAQGAEHGGEHGRKDALIHPDRADEDHLKGVHALVFDSFARRRAARKSASTSASRLPRIEGRAPRIRSVHSVTSC
jgi:serine protease SohB